MVQLSQPYVATGKTRALTIRTFVGRVMSLLFTTLSRFVIAFLSRSNCLLISRMQSLSAVILEPKKRKSVTTSTFSPCICYAVIGPDAKILVFSTFSLKPAVSLSSFTLIKRLLSSSLLSAIKEVSSAYLRLLMFLSPILILTYNSLIKLSQHKSKRILKEQDRCSLMISWKDLGSTINISWWLLNLDWYIILCSC